MTTILAEKTCTRCRGGVPPLHRLVFRRPAGGFPARYGESVGGGCVKYREDVVEGLENAPAAFLGLLQGKKVA
jgi:hypothetical protein